MAKKKENNRKWFILGGIVLFLFIVSYSPGGTDKKTGSFGCSSGGGSSGGGNGGGTTDPVCMFPSYNSVLSTSSIESFLSSLLSNDNNFNYPVDSYAPQFCDSLGDEGLACSFMSVRTLNNPGDFCEGHKETSSNYYCLETYTLIITKGIESISFDEFKSELESGQTPNGDLIIIKSYKDITYYEIPFTIDVDGTISLEDSNLFLLTDKEYIVMGTDRNGINTIEEFIDEYYTCS